MADELEMNRSYFSKMRRGDRDMTPAVADYLIERFGLDRIRLDFAYAMYGNCDNYGDPAFMNLCIYVKIVMQKTMERALASRAEGHEFHIGMVSSDRAEQLALAADETLKKQFAALDAVQFAPLPLQANSRV